MKKSRVRERRETPMVGGPRVVVGPNTQNRGKKGYCNKCGANLPGDPYGSISASEMPYCWIMLGLSD